MSQNETAKSHDSERASDRHRRRPWLCRLGIHAWSEHRGGIKVCERDGCRRAKTYGLTGTMRWLEWQEELYEEYQRFTSEKERREGD